MKLIQTVVYQNSLIIGREYVLQPFEGNEAAYHRIFGEEVNVRVFMNNTVLRWDELHFTHSSGIPEDKYLKECLQSKLYAVNFNSSASI